MPSAELQGLILAGGEGSRLREDGVAVPKAMVPVAGRPQAVHLVETLLALGCPSVTCLVRDEFPEALDGLRARHWPAAVGIHACRTPSSLHTLAEGLARAPAGPVFATMVDTAMRPADWRDVFARARAALGDGADAVLAVTPYVDDESALYVEAAEDGRVRRISNTPLAPVRVTGGVYAFAPAVRALAREAVDAGVSRMRNFLARLVDRGLAVVAVPVPRIVDLDRLTDLRAANAWLGGGADADARGG